MTSPPDLAPQSAFVKCIAKVYAYFANISDAIADLLYTITRILHILFCRIPRAVFKPRPDYVWPIVHLYGVIVLDVLYMQLLSYIFLLGSYLFGYSYGTVHEVIAVAWIGLGRVLRHSNGAPPMSKERQQELWTEELKKSEDLGSYPGSDLFAEEIVPPFVGVSRADVVDYLTHISKRLLQLLNAPVDLYLDITNLLNSVLIPLGFLSLLPNPKKDVIAMVVDVCILAAMWWYRHGSRELSPMEKTFQYSSLAAGNWTAAAMGRWLIPPYLPSQVVATDNEKGLPLPTVEEK
jgi:hypothetical protein